MVLLRSGFGMKIALGALGLLLGVGGVAAGASFHAAHRAPQDHPRIVLGHIISHADNVLVIRLRNGQTIMVHLAARTIIRHRGRPASDALLQPDTYVLVQLARAKNGDLYAVRISILKLAPSAQGP